MAVANRTAEMLIEATAAKRLLALMVIVFLQI